MAPPSRPANSGPGKGEGAQIIQFPGNPVTETTDIPTPSSVSSVPPSDPSSPRVSRPSFHDFTDFSDLEAIFAGRNASQSVGGYGKIQLYLGILANPAANGGYEARFARDNQTCEITQEKPGDPIRVKFFRDPPSVLSGSNPHQIPKFQLTYYPDGELGHAVRFDEKGQALTETRVKEISLRSAALGAHETTLDFLRRRSQQLGRGREAFNRMEAPLQQLRPSALDLAKRGAWYRNFAVVNGKVYSLHTQNFGFGALEQYPSQNLISIFEDQGARNIELFRLSKTGEINYVGEGTARRPPDPQQSTLIDRLSHQLERAHGDPQVYQRHLHGTLVELEKSLSAKFERPEIIRTPVQWSPNPAIKGAAYDEPMQTITKGKHLLRIILPFWPQTWRWENPENPKDVRKLRPKGKIRWAMFKEYARWTGGAIWNGTINHMSNLKPQAGELRLHLLPDGSADLEIYRNFTKNFPDGTLREERGIYNILRRNADKTLVDLGDIVRQIAREQPDILHRPRAEQLKLAAQTLTSSSDLPRSLDIQSVPAVPIHQLWTEGRGPQSAAEALEAIRQLPQLMGLNAQVSSDPGKKILPRMETVFEMIFPGSQPPTQMLIHEEGHTTGKRVVINLLQGDNVATAVYDDGTFNQHESARLNLAEVHRARQGTVKPPTWHGWYGLRILWNGIGFLWRGGAQVRTYTEVHALPYALGYVSALPAALAYERAFWTPEQRERIGTPIPAFTYRALKNEFWAAMAMGGFAGGTAVGVDGFFNYGGGLINTTVDKFKKSVHWRDAYRFHAPRLMNPPPARLRPIPLPPFNLAQIRQSPSPGPFIGRSLNWGASYLRSFLQRGLPLFSGLFAVECYRSLGPNWKMRDIFFGDYKVNWNTISKNLYHVGAVSLLSSGAWGLAGRRTELALARRAAGQEIRGLGGFLLRNKLLAHAPSGMAGARFALTYRATLATVALESMALGIWDSYERKQNLVQQEKDMRGDLSRSMDRYNRILSRLKHGEEISPTKLQEAEAEVQGAYQGYRAYLKMMGKEQGAPTHSTLQLENDYETAYGAKEKDYWVSRAGPIDGVGQDSALSQWDHQNKLEQMREKEVQTERRLRELYSTHGIPMEDPQPETNLREFLARTTQVLQQDPGVLDEALASGPSVRNPIALDSMEARALIDHLKWKIEKDQGFLRQNPGEQARYILKTFSGYRVTLPDGKLRPWTEQEAIAFLNDLHSENHRRLTNLEEPLIKPSEKNLPSPEVMEKVAEEQRKILAEGNVGNLHVGKMQAALSENGAALDKQMEDYFKKTAEKRDNALLRFLPQEFLAAQQVPAQAEVL